jgi:cobaltochelatase CobT
VADLMGRRHALQDTAEASSLALAIFARWRAWAEANPASPLAGALADHTPEALTEPLIGLREELTEALAQLPATHSDAGYRIYTTERDEVLTAPAGATGSYAALLAEVKPHVSVLRQKLLLTLKGQARTRLAPDPDGPILQTKRLHQLLLPVPQAPLASKVNAPAQNVAVSLLVDLSGSMRGPRIRLAQACAVLLSEVLDQLGYPCEVLGFTTATDHSGLEPVLTESGLKPTEIEAGFTRYLPLRHVIYKAFGERLRACRERFASMEVSHYTPLNESVVFAGRRLLAVPGSRHLLMVLTDGAPFLGTRATADAALWNLKANLERLGRAGVETLAIGIQSDYVRQAFSQAIVIQELSGLPREFMTALSKQLLAGTRKRS